MWKGEYSWPFNNRGCAGKSICNFYLALHIISSSTSINSAKHGLCIYCKYCSIYYWKILGFPGGTVVKEPTYQCRRNKGHSFSPWVEKILWRKNDNLLQYSCQENPMDRGAWRAAVHGVTKSRTQLSTCTYIYTHIEKYYFKPMLFKGQL